MRQVCPILAQFYAAAGKRSLRVGGPLWLPKRHHGTTPMDAEQPSSRPDETPVEADKPSAALAALDGEVLVPKLRIERIKRPDAASAPRFTQFRLGGRPVSSLGFLSSRRMRPTRAPGPYGRTRP